MDTYSKRDQIRNLVKEVLSRFPDTEHGSVVQVPEIEPEHILVNSLKSQFGREFDRDESSKSLITEDDIRGLANGSRLRIAKDAKFTPLANDLIAERGLVLIVKDERTVQTVVRTAAIGADHGGFSFKEALKPFLESLGIQALDFGTNSTDAVDYPDFALAVGRAVAGKNADIGILIDGAGIGSAMAANKVPGVRAAACYSAKLAANSREHNGANVLTIGSGISTLDEVKEIVRAFVSTAISEDRHKRRVAKIDSIEKEFSK